MKKISILAFVVVAMLVSASAFAAGLQKVDINAATKQELMSLDGIGSELADRIIEYRSVTPFRSPEDLKSVKGIGDGKYEKNKERIMVGKPPVSSKAMGAKDKKEASASSKAQKSN